MELFEHEAAGRVLIQQMLMQRNNHVRSLFLQFISFDSTKSLFQGGNVMSRNVI